MKLGITFETANIDEVLDFIDSISGDLSEYMQASETGCHIILESVASGTFQEVAQKGYVALPLLDDMKINDYADIVDAMPCIEEPVAA